MMNEKWTWRIMLDRSNERRRFWTWPAWSWQYWIGKSNHPTWVDCPPFGKPLFQFGREGWIPYLAVWPDGSVYIVTQHHRVYRYRPNGWRHDVMPDTIYRGKYRDFTVPRRTCIEDVGFGPRTWCPQPVVE